MEIFYRCNLVVWNLFKLWLHFEHAFQTLRIRRHTNRNFWSMSSGFWGVRLCRLHNLHKKNNQIQECNRLCVYFCCNFCNCKRFVNEHSYISKSADITDDFGDGFQPDTYGAYQLWPRLLAILPGGWSTNRWPFVRWFNDLHSIININNHFSSRIRDT